MSGSLFDRGVSLSTYDALCPPTDPGADQQSDDCQELP